MKEFTTKSSALSCAGFTLVEVMVAMSIMVMVVGAAMSVFIMHQRMAIATTNIITGSQDLSVAMDQIVYGDSEFAGLREATAETVTLDQYGNNSWWLRFESPSKNNQWIRYQKNQDRIRRKGGSRHWLLTNVEESTAALTNNGIVFMIQVTTEHGGVIRTNQMETFVQFRN